MYLGQFLTTQVKGLQSSMTTDVRRTSRVLYDVWISKDFVLYDENLFLINCLVSLCTEYVLSTKSELIFNYNEKPT